MRPTSLLALALAAATGLAAAAPMANSSAADFTISLEVGESDSVASGTVAGINPGHFAGTDDLYPCGASGDVTAYCQSILVQVTNPYDEADAKKGRERASLGLVLTMEGLGDLALLVYDSDEDGTRGDEVASSDGLGETTEATSIAVSTTADEQERWYLVEVFFHAFSGSWTLDADFT